MEQDPGAPSSPFIKLPTSEGELVLHWFNSRVRTFSDPQYDHVEHFVEDQTQGLNVGRAILDRLLEHDWPNYFTPFVDEASFNWYVAQQTNNIDKEWEEL